MLKKIDLKILGAKELIASFSIISGIFIFFILINRFTHVSEVLMLTDVVFPIILAIPSLVLFKFHLLSEMTNVVKVYGASLYNKYILKLILHYLLVITGLFFVFSLIILFIHNINGVIFVWKGIDFKNVNIIFVLLKSYVNLIFLTIAIMFIVKISKNLIFTFFTIGLYIFQEIAGMGSYTEPLNLFVVYEQRSMYSTNLILMNRFFFIALALGMLYYIITKNN